MLRDDARIEVATLDPDLGDEPIRWLDAVTHGSGMSLFSPIHDRPPGSTDILAIRLFAWAIACLGHPAACLVALSALALALRQA